jgi:uncharacterized protein YybS (DUF2232 family)
MVLKGQGANTIDVLKIGPKKLMLFGATSAALCLSVFLAPLAALPLAPMFLMTERNKGLLVVLFGTVTVLFLSWGIFGRTYLVWAYAFSSILALLLAESVKRNIHPVRAAFLSAFAILGGISLVMVSWPLWHHGVGLREYLIQEVAVLARQVAANNAPFTAGAGAQSEMILEKLKDPQAFVDGALPMIPATIWMFIFIWAWVHQLLLLRTARFLPGGAGYKWGIENLLTWKTPEIMVWAVILSFLGILLGDKVTVFPVAVISLEFLRAMAVFYFFQGFGLYSRFLDWIRIPGLFKTALVVMVVVLAAWSLALVGIFDTWFDFSKFLKKQNENKDTGDHL